MICCTFHWGWISLLLTLNLSAQFCPFLYVSKCCLTVGPTKIAVCVFHTKMYGSVCVCKKTLAETNPRNMEWSFSSHFSPILSEAALNSLCSHNVAGTLCMRCHLHIMNSSAQVFTNYPWPPGCCSQYRLMCRCQCDLRINHLYAFEVNVCFFYTYCHKCSYVIWLFEQHSGYDISTLVSLAPLFKSHLGHSLHGVCIFSQCLQGFPITFPKTH